MPDCVSCTTLPPCDCSDTQICVLVGRSCDSCGENTCQDDPSKAGSKGGGSSAGATAGEAIGGALGALLLALAIWWFWRRKKRQQMAQRGAGTYGRASGYRDNTQGNSSGLKVRFGEDAKPGSSPAPRRSNRMSRSMAMNLEEKGMPSSPDAAPQHNAEQHVSSPASQREDPFGDQHSTILIDAENPSENEKISRSASQRSQRAKGTRASQTSAPMPAAYIPAHANSISISDGLDRDSLGARRQRNSQGDATSPVPELRLSLGPLPQTEEQVMASSAHGSSPGQSTPGSATPGGSSKAKPARPTREGLDLRLPPPSNTSTKTASFGVSSPPVSPGFPWSPGEAHASGIEPPPPTTATNSRFSSTTSRDSYATDGRYSLAPPSLNRPNSTATSAHMSYILNPPQIVTATSTGRVGVVGPAIAKTVQLGSSAPNTPGAIEALDAQSAVPPVPHRPQSSPLKRDTISTLASDDPFADEVSAVIGQFPNPLATPTFGSNTPTTPITPSQKGPSPLRHSATQGEEEPMHRSSRANTPTSMVFSSGPSARNSYASEGAFDSRPNTIVSTTGRPVSKDSLLDSMPFRPPLPPHQDSSRGSVPSSSKSNDKRQTQATLGELVADDMDAPLPEPNRPYAAAAGNAERHSNASSLGALEGIPFNLGFSGNDRASVWSEASDGTGLRDSHFSTSMDAPPVPSVDLSRNSRTDSKIQPEPAISRQDSWQGSLAQTAPVAQDGASTLSSDEAERLRTPAPDATTSFQQQQQQQQSQIQQSSAQPQPPGPSAAAVPQAQQPTASEADNRASVDSFLQSALLAQQFENAA